MKSIEMLQRKIAAAAARHPGDIAAANRADQADLLVDQFVRGLGALAEKMEEAIQVLSEPTGWDPPAA